VNTCVPVLARRTLAGEIPETEGGWITSILKVLSAVAPLTLSVIRNNMEFVAAPVALPPKVAGDAVAEPKVRPFRVPLTILNVTALPPISSVAVRFSVDVVPDV
jgi:hypothetical protein